MDKALLRDLANLFAPPAVSGELRIEFKQA
jgi:hypothetical protein